MNGGIKEDILAQDDSRPAIRLLRHPAPEIRDGARFHRQGKSGSDGIIRHVREPMIGTPDGVLESPRILMADANGYLRQRSPLDDADGIDGVSHRVPVGSNQAAPRPA